MVRGPHRRPPSLFLGQRGPGILSHTLPCLHTPQEAWRRLPLLSGGLRGQAEPPSAIPGSGGLLCICVLRVSWGGVGEGGEGKKEVSWVDAARCLLPMVVSPELCPGPGGGRKVTSLPCTSEPLPCSHQPGWGDSIPARAQQPSLPPLPPHREGKNLAWAVPRGALVVSMPWLH